MEIFSTYLAMKVAMIEHTLQARIIRMPCAFRESALVGIAEEYPVRN